ncbi:triacylglycerol lipase [Hypoxylon sp. FL1150]|nr:triacylglycerol lipase [Hypoxylon sp. FL1150]
MATTDSNKLSILLVSLNLASFFDESYAGLLSQFMSKATVQRIEERDSAIRRLSEAPRPSTVLVTDEALTWEENASVWEAVLQYVRQGGTAVVMGHFPNFAWLDHVKPFFSKAGLPWETATYRNRTVVLNRDAVGDSLAAHLPQRYSQKFLSLKNVALADAWYVAEEYEDEDVMSTPTNANATEGLPVVLARVGDGKLGYIGDVNPGEEFTAVVLAMCGLS